MEGHGEAMSDKWGISHFNVVARHLQPDENVRLVFTGMMEDTNVYRALAVTEHRLLIGQKQFTGEFFQVIPLQDVKNVALSMSMLTANLKINTTATILAISISPKNNGQTVLMKLNSIVSDYQLDSRQQAQAAPQNASADFCAKSIAEQLRELNLLVYEGLLTQEEFEEQKRRVLGK